MKPVQIWVRGGGGGGGGGGWRRDRPMSLSFMCFGVQQGNSTKGPENKLPETMAHGSPCH